MLTRRQMLLAGSGGAAALLLGSCAGDGSAPRPDSPDPSGGRPDQPSPTADAGGGGGGSQPISTLAARRSRLRRRLLDLDVPSTVTFGVFAYNRTTGETYGFRSGRAYETASVVKVDILAALLVQAQQDGRWLTAGQRSLARQMMVVSSNDAATALFRQVGRVAGLRDANDSFGLTRTRPNSAWGLTTTSPRDQVRLLNRLSSGSGPLDARSRRYVRSLMTEVASDQDWGVSAAGRRGETILVKNGWLPRSTQSGRWLINSVGRIIGDDADIRLAVLSRGHPVMSSGVRRIERIARLVRSTLDW